MTALQLEEAIEMLQLAQRRGAIAVELETTHDSRGDLLDVRVKLAHPMLLLRLDPLGEASDV